jgi:putative phosphoesterase
MLAVIADTHGTDDARLRGRTREAVVAADAVVHAGDFTTEAALDGLAATAGTLYAVHGNSDDPAVRERLPDARTLAFGGATIAVTHTRRGGRTGLSLFGRERGADLVVFGHSHRPTALADGDGPTLLNPGSHAEPRGKGAAHAELEATPSGLDGRIVTPAGDVLASFSV